MDEIYTISISLAIILGVFILFNIISMLGYIAWIVFIIVVASLLISVYVPMPEWMKTEWFKNIPEWFKNIPGWFKKKEVPAPLTTDTMMPEESTEEVTPSAHYLDSVDMPPKIETPVTSPLDMHNGNEVFHVQGQFDYAMSRAVCKSYGAQLATYDQIKSSHEKGAEWCEYGWSEDSMVLYPTQYSSWEKFKESDDPQRCGIPGVNGGYNNDTSQQLGANCYGKKPAGKITPFSYPKVKARPTPEYSVSPFNYTSWSVI